MKQILHLLFVLFVPFQVLSQVDSSAKDAQKDTVIICGDKMFKAFHSHKDCPGLDTCDDSPQYVTAAQAMEVFGRNECCICWEDPLKDCENDNPAYTNATYEGDIEEDYEEDYEESRNDEIYVDDVWWLVDGAPFYYLGMVAGAAVFFSNEVYIGPSYSFLPPKLTLDSDFELETSFGIDVIFRKNLKKDAFEYGFNYHDYGLINENATPNQFDTKSTFMFMVSYLHQLNQHFSTLPKSKDRFKIYAGPIMTFGFPTLGDELPVDKFGIGGTVILSLKLGDRFHLDMRSEFTHFSSEAKIGIRWLYQKEYPWQK